MNNGRRVELDVTYNNAPFAGQVGAEIESLTYVDNAADDSDSIDITLDAQDSKWLHGWLPEEGATLRPRIIGRDWNGPGDTHVMECGLFILDDVAYQDAPTTLQVGGVSKPSNTDFSELERETIWKNTSIKRIGESIAGRYGLGFTYDADDYDIECDEQDGTDSSYYNTLCKNYGLILKVYAKRLWVYDRERYKGKRAVQDFDRTNIIPGSLSYKPCPGIIGWNEDTGSAAKWAAFKARLGAATPGGQTGGSTNTGTATGNTALTYKVGDIVQFAGGKHYANAQAASGTTVKPGPAKVTAVATAGKHPYHLVHTDGTSTVYGWVDAAAITGKASATPAAKTYTVKAGDSLWRIAAQQLGNGARYKEIKTLNGLKNNTIHAGQVLKLPN